jgi:hypothetical protein
MRKVLWVVDGDMNDLLDRADFVRAQAVCVRTTNAWLKASIKTMKQRGFDVYAWRWPSVDPASDSNHHYADSEANFVVDLISEGLDGYIVDPEADEGRATDNWNDASFADLANSFCNKIKLAGRAKNPHFLFGTTSGCDYPKIMPNIPWSTFVAHSDAVYPQIYWAPNFIKAHRTNPDDAWRIGMGAWSRVVPSGMTIVPILGEIEVNKDSDIARFGQIMNEHNMADEVHFYTFTGNMMNAKFTPMWQALRNLGNTPLVV